MADLTLGQGEEYELRPNAMRLYDIRVDAKIVGWRMECFERLGFNSVEAVKLARRRDVDREAVERWRAQGATPEQVLTILEVDE